VSAAQPLGRSAELAERAARVIPGGVSSSLRAMGALLQTPKLHARFDSWRNLREVLVRSTLVGALQVLEKGAQTIAFVCASDNKVLGTLTDGDARRAILAGAPLDSRCLLSAMSGDFAYARPDSGRAEVLDIMRARGIGQLPILDDAGRLCGLHTVGQMITGVERPNWALLLAGGFGTRLSPITDTTPKPMVPVAGRPILERLILHLMSHGIRNFFLAVNHLAHLVEDHFGDGARFFLDDSPTTPDEDEHGTSTDAPRVRPGSEPPRPPPDARSDGGPDPPDHELYRRRAPRRV